MNKGAGIAIAIGIAIAAIGGAYAFFGIQENGPSDESSGIDVKDTAEVEITAPTAEEPEVLPDEGAELGIRDSAEVEVEEPEDVIISAEEKIGFKSKP